MKLLPSCTSTWTCKGVCEVACGFREKCGVVDGKGWCVVWDSVDSVVLYTPRCRRLDRKRFRMQKKKPTQQK